MVDLRKRIEACCVEQKLPFSPHTLGGACGICSLIAFRALKRMGLIPVFHMNREHCFITVNLGDVNRWLDLTLTQFVPFSDPVYFQSHPYRTGTYGHVHRRTKSATSERAIRKLFSDWPPEQNPFVQSLPQIWKRQHLTSSHEE